MTPSPMPFPPFGINLDRNKPGSYHVMTAVEGLSEVLTQRWPEEHEGDTWRAALTACLRALETQTNAEAAKSAFIMAAEDAGFKMMKDAAHFEPPPRDGPKKKRR